MPILFEMTQVQFWMHFDFGSWVLVAGNKYSILPQRDSRTSLVLVPVLQAELTLQVLRLQFGPLWTLRKCMRSGVGDCPGVLSNTVDLAMQSGRFLHQEVSPAVWGFFKLMMSRRQFWDDLL